jgi:prefoldin subunit 5
MTIEEEVKELEEAKETLEERLANVNKRLEALKR